MSSNRILDDELLKNIVTAIALSSIPEGISAFKKIELELLVFALNRYPNQRSVARLFGIPKSTLHDRLKYIQRSNVLETYAINADAANWNGHKIIGRNPCED